MTLDDKVKILTDGNGHQVVQMDIDVYEAIKTYIEDQGLLELMMESDMSDTLNPEEAKAYYNSLPKHP